MFSSSENGEVKIPLWGYAVSGAVVTLRPKFFF
jgi:hypothetical protein